MTHPHTNHNRKRTKIPTQNSKSGKTQANTYTQTDRPRTYKRQKWSSRILSTRSCKTVRRGVPCCRKALVSFRHLSQRITSVNWCCLVWVLLIKFASNTGVGFQLCKTQNAIRFQRHRKQTKEHGTQLSIAARMRLEYDLDQAEKTGTVTTLNELAYN